MAFAPGVWAFQPIARLSSPIRADAHVFRGERVSFDERADKVTDELDRNLYYAKAKRLGEAFKGSV